MSEFVNYKKRKITLPAGCKDLADLLRPHGQHGIHGEIGLGAQPTTTRDWVVTGTLSDMAQNLAP